MMYVMAITNPAANADSEATSNPNLEPDDLKKGATGRAANTP